MHGSRSRVFRLLQLNTRHGSRFSSTPRIAVVGSGPAGLFTCASLLRRSSAKFDVFDASPVPFGLVRYGVAPDHQEVKNCINGFDKMFETNRDRLSLFCNVRIGTDVSFEELTQSYDGILLAYGAHRPRRLNLPGEYSKNVFSGSDFVSWYNGVPHAKTPLLDSPNVVIIGNGNVALDCARIISTGARGDSLRSSDVPSEYLRVLENSVVDNIKIMGRRGPTNISFTVKELREQFRVKNWETSVEMDAIELESTRLEVDKMDRRRKRLMQVLLDGVKSPSSPTNQCRFLFHRTPEEILADGKGRVHAVRVKNSAMGGEEELPCGLLIYSIGYETIVLDGVPKNEKGMISMVDECRVNMPATCPSLVFAAGWCAHGPRGVIVDTQQQASFVADQMAKELKEREGGSPGVVSLLNERDVEYVSWDEWKRMDVEERERGKEKGKVREKITEFASYLTHKRH